MSSAESFPDWTLQLQDGLSFMGQTSGSQRHQQTKKMKLVKGLWTEEEDQRIKELVEKYGTKNWSSIAKEMHSRNGKQCRDRWSNHLDPSVKKGNWTVEEDHVICQAQRQKGNRWAAISRLLPGRTELAVKNRWHTTLRKRLDQQDLSSTIFSINEPAPRYLSSLNQASTISTVHQEDPILQGKNRTPSDVREQTKVLLESSSATPVKFRHRMDEGKGDCARLAGGGEFHRMMFGRTDDQRSQTERARNLMETLSAQPATGYFLLNSL